MPRIAALVLLSCACSTGSAPVQAQQPPATPPGVLLGDATLHCSISARENGRQTLTMLEGGGLEFDAAVSPIVDGTVELKGEKKGGVYRFTSHLAAPAKGKLAGVGDVDIEALETRVTVELKGYRQPGGPGTALEFSSDDMVSRGIYVEFTGTVRNAKGERWAYRINLGPTKSGGGRVEPASANERAPLAAKVVEVRAPSTTVIEARTTLAPAP